MSQLTWWSQSSAPWLIRWRRISSACRPPGVLPISLPRSLLLAVVVALVLWRWSAALRLWWLSPVCAPVIVLLLLLLLCMSISGLRLIIVAVVPAVLLVSLLLVSLLLVAVIVLLVVIVLVIVVLLLSLRRVLLIVMLRLLLLARLRAPVVLLLVCHGDAGRVIVYRAQQSHMHRARSIVE
jgi:hypothetical protein